MTPTELPEGREVMLTPRVAGAALMVVSAASGVIAALFISHPLWGIPAAILLAFASVGVTAGLLLIRRTSWADKTWPPGVRSRNWDEKRTRRHLLVYGAFLLVVAIAAATGILFRHPGDIDQTARTWLLLGIFGVIGAVFVVMGLRPVPPAVTSSTRPDHDASSESAEWVRLGPEGSVAGIQSWTAGALVYQPFLAPVLVVSFLPGILQVEPWVAAAVVGLAAAAIVLMVSIARRRTRPPWVARDGSALRRGAKEVSASDIASASLFFVPWMPDATERSLTITFAAPGRFRTTVGLRKRGRLVLTQTETDLLVELVSRSSIAMPRAKEDPTGRFSKMLYPSHLTREEAITVIEIPPGDGEPLSTITQLPG